ncbi:MAG: helix-turn-helix domain-containing protein [Deltaproteobacteria bacterium]|nr:helix-turn-helix domain-containing protein [Deltaproteobacteria bacterium]
MTDDKRIYCSVLEGVTFAERCLYELSKVIQGSKTCESCIFREFQRLKKGIVIGDKPSKKNKDKRKRKATRRTPREEDIKGSNDIKEIKGINGSNDIKEMKEADDLKISPDTDDQGAAGKSALGVEDVSKLIGRSRRRVQEYAKKGKIQARKIGQHWVFDKEEIDCWLRKGSGVAIEPEELRAEERVPEGPEPDTGESFQNSEALPPDRDREEPGDVF